MSGPSSNWQKLQKQLTKTLKRKGRDDRKSTRRNSELPSNQSTSPGPSNNPLAAERDVQLSKQKPTALQSMVLGHDELNEKQKLPGKYLALDCEMVGVGTDGEESSLARVSLVNFYGAVILDEFVKQRERVVDYRTQWSGIRETDMIHAKPFLEVQKQVADLLQDRILVGHAVHNDLKALLLSHPYPLTRDTQVLAYKAKLVKTKRPALRNLVKDEIGMTIQGGEHSSVTDARATMAVYRIHKKEWDRLCPPPSALENINKKRKRSDMDDQDEDEDEAADSLFDAKPKTKAARKSVDLGQGRKGVSSGLSTIVRRGGQKPEQQKQEWWKQLPSKGSKGSVKLSR